MMAKRLGTSVASVRRLEGRVLHPQRGERGVWLFSAAEVARAASTYAGKQKRPSTDDGELAARAFELFRLGHDLAAIVVELRQQPRTIRELYAEWIVDLSTGQFERERLSDEHERLKDEREHERITRPLRR